MHDISNTVTLHRRTGRAKELPGSDYILYALRPLCSQLPGSDYILFALRPLCSLCLLSGMTKPQRRLAHSVLFGGYYVLCGMFRHSEPLRTFGGFVMLWNVKL